MDKEHVLCWHLVFSRVTVWCRGCCWASGARWAWHKAGRVSPVSVAGGYRQWSCPGSSCVNTTSADPLVPCSAAALEIKSMKCILRSGRGTTWHGRAPFCVSHLVFPPSQSPSPSQLWKVSSSPLATARSVTYAFLEETKIGSSGAEHVG